MQRAAAACTVNRLKFCHACMQRKKWISEIALSSICYSTITSKLSSTTTHEPLLHKSIQYQLAMDDMSKQKATTKATRSTISSTLKLDSLTQTICMHTIIQDRRPENINLSPNTSIYACMDQTVDSRACQLQYFVTLCYQNPGTVYMQYVRASLKSEVKSPNTSQPKEALLLFLCETAAPIDEFAGRDRFRAKSETHFQTERNQNTLSDKESSPFQASYSLPAVSLRTVKTWKLGQGDDKKI